ncbi:hypothetical protein IAT38_004278 [Cryptococcus sp. DSM 104549]
MSSITKNTLFTVFFGALLFLLPVHASPAPDTIFLLKESSFTSLGCSTTFRPLSILHDVPSPAACFSRCSSREIAAYTQLSSSGVLCACGSPTMLEGIQRMDPCKGNNWYLWENNEVEEREEVVQVEMDGEEGEGVIVEFVSSFSRKAKKAPGRPMPFPMMKKKVAQKNAGKTTEV